MRRVLSLLILMGFTCPCMAKVDLKSTKPLKIPVDNVTPRITTEDVAKIIPTDVNRGTTTSQFVTRVADKTFNLWFNSAAMKNSALGRAVETTQEKLKTDVEVKADTPEGISHKISVRIDAFQALAKLEYKGWVNCALNYDAKSSESLFQLKEKVLDNKNLIVSHKATRDQDLSMIGLAWSW